MSYSILQLAEIIILNGTIRIIFSATMKGDRARFAGKTRYFTPDKMTATEVDCALAGTRSPLNSLANVRQDGKAVGRDVGHSTNGSQLNCEGDSRHPILFKRSHADRVDNSSTARIYAGIF